MIAYNEEMVETLENELGEKKEHRKKLKERKENIH